jgi:hypothetical protein
MNTESSRTIFIGPRTLEKEEVQIIVPTFDVLMNRIEDMRREAYNKRHLNHKNYTQRYNNTITIFGDRGTGKTSTMYTIINELRAKTNNILLDIIEPDNIGIEGKIMGCVLGFFKEEVDKLEFSIRKKEEQSGISSTKIKKEFFRDCRFKENNILKQAYNEVLEYYCYTETDYKTLLIKSYDDMNSYIKKSSYVFNADIEFSKKFEKFVDLFIEIKKSLHEEGGEGKEDNSFEDEPLIFIFIDDVDLNTSKCQEIIEAILKYASHSNIICVLTGDYATFTEEFTISLLKREKLKEGNLTVDINVINGMSILDSKRELAREYMKKVFPPAYRYYVNMWKLKVRPNYKFVNGGTEKGNIEDLFELLSGISARRGIENIFGYMGESEADREHFLPAFNIFDRTSRGLINAYYSLWKMKNVVDDYGTREYFINFKNVIENVLDSSNLFLEHLGEIKNNFILWGDDESQSKIDFEQIELYFSNMDKDKTLKKNNTYESKYAIFYLCYYITVVLPKIQYSPEKRRTVSKLAMFELIKNPVLNGQDTIIKIDDLIESYFTGSTLTPKNEEYNHTYCINFKEYICDILCESELYFSQMFYKKLVDSELFNYKIFTSEVNVSDEIMNELYIALYRALYKDKEEATEFLLNLYNNEMLNKYLTFLQIKTSEDIKINHIQQNFKILLEFISKKIIARSSKQNWKFKNKAFFMKDEVLQLLKCEFTKTCQSVLSLQNNLLEYVKQLESEYDELQFQLKLEELTNAVKDRRARKKEVNNLGKLESIESLLEKRKKYILIDLLRNAMFSEINKQVNEENQYKGINNKLNEIFADRLVNIMFKDMTQNGFFIKDEEASNESFIKFDLDNDDILENLNEFLNYNEDIDGASFYKKRIKGVFTVKNSNYQALVKKLDCLSISEYYILKYNLTEIYSRKSEYGSKEAKALIDSLDKNVKLKIRDGEEFKDFFDEEDRWIIKAYYLYMERFKNNVQISDLSDAKSYFSEVLEEARLRKELEDDGYI